MDKIKKDFSQKSRLLAALEKQSNLSANLQLQIEALESQPGFDDRLMKHKLRGKIQADRKRLNIAEKLRDLGYDFPEDFTGAAA